MYMSSKWISLNKNHSDVHNFSSDCNCICVTMQYLMRGWFLCCRFNQQTAMSSHSSWCLVHHCSTGEKLLLIHNLTMPYQVLISNFLIILTGLLRIEETGPWGILVETLDLPHVKVRKSI